MEADVKGSGGVGDRGIEDMIVLPELTEQSLLDNIRIRYEKDIIYVSLDKLPLSLH